VALGDRDDVFDQLSDVLVAFDGDGDDAAAAGGDFLDVGERLFVLQDRAGVGGVFGGDADDGEGLVDEGVGAVLHLAGCPVHGRGLSMSGLLVAGGVRRDNRHPPPAHDDETVMNGAPIVWVSSGHPPHKRPRETGFGRARFQPGRSRPPIPSLPAASAAL